MVQVTGQPRSRDLASELGWEKPRERSWKRSCCIHALSNFRYEELCIQCASAQCPQVLSLRVLYGHMPFVFIKV